MKEPLNKMLSQTAIETFEKLAFLFAFPEEEGYGEEMGSMVSAGVVFSGPFSGSLVIAVSVTVLPELAANMLGIDEGIDISLDQQHDALKESLNVICGNLLPAIAGREPIFNMEMPVILSESGGGKKGVAGVAEGEVLSKAKLTFDEGGCELSFYVNGEIPDGAIIL